MYREGERKLVWIGTRRGREGRGKGRVRGGQPIPVQFGNYPQAFPAHLPPLFP